MSERNKLSKPPFLKLLAFIRPYIFYVIPGLAFEIVSVSVRLMGPGRLSRITDLISEGLSGKMDIVEIVKICVFLLAAYALGAVLSYFTSLIMTKVTQRINKKLRSDISLKINRLPAGYFHKTSTGDILSRVTNDVDAIGQTMQQSVVTLVSSSAMFVGSVTVMFVTQPLLAVCATVPSLIGFIIVGRIVKRSRRYFSERQQSLGSINGHVEEMYSGHTVVRLFNAEDTEKKKFNVLNERMYKANKNSQFFSGLMQPIMNFAGNIGYVSVCIAGAALVLSSKLNFGTIVAFMVYVRLFTAPLSGFAQGLGQLQITSAASGRVFEFLETEEIKAESDTKKLSTVKGEVVFERVRFGYSPDKTVIKNFSEKINAGQKVAIVGPTGAGKTTLVNLLMRFYEVSDGRILIDGVPIKEISRKDLRDMFGMVLQDTWLMDASIRENIVYGKEGITDERVWGVLKTAGLYRFVKELPKGLDTVINEKLTLSAGQKQLVTIARAMIEDAPMLILDEATSSVDTRTEAVTVKAMDELSAGKTSFVIAHRLSTIKNADKILVMKDGDVIETGTHRELIKKGGFYSELYKSQFDK